MKKFNKKVILITGAAGDLGRQLVKDFLAEDGKVLAVDTNREKLLALKDQCDSNSLVTSVVDVTNSTDMQAVAILAEEKFGGLDVAVFNAGIVGQLMSIINCPEEIFDSVMRVNVKGVWLGIKYVSPLLKLRGGGSIVLMSSIAGLVGYPDTSAYIASKHAVVGLARGAAKELAADNIRVNSVNPGQLEIGMVREFNEDQRAEIISEIPLGRLGTAGDITRMTLFLASEDSRYITGTTNVVDGGYLGF